VSKLSDYLNAHIPAGWSKAQVVDAMEGKVDRATVYRYLAGQHPQRPAEPILEAFASGLPGTSLTELRLAVGMSAGEESPWVPTSEANRLSHAQRMALDTFIRATIAAQDEAAVRVIEELLAEREHNPNLGSKTQRELDDYMGLLQASGRGELAERLAASLAINSASQTAKRSSKQ